MTKEMSVVEKLRFVPRSHTLKISKNEAYMIGQVAHTAADEIERLQGLLVPHVCLCGRTATVPPSEHGERCPYRILCLQEQTP